jgi:hypothetical protein
MNRFLALATAFLSITAALVVGSSVSPVAAVPSVHPDAAPVPTACAFPIIVDKADANVAYPDTNSTYWVMLMDLQVGDSATITGTFAYSRYMSFNTYDAQGASAGGLTDARIVPDSGSSNPFSPGVALDATPRSYTVTVNVTTTPTIPSVVPGAIDTLPGLSWLIYRVYVPNPGTGNAAGVPLPAMITQIGANPPIVYPPCTAWHKEPLVDAIAALITGGVLAGAIPPAPQPEFAFPGGAAGLFPNADNKYVYATTTWAPGRLIIVRAKAPTTPDTPTQPLYPQQQLRYWSLCTNLLVLPAPVVECKHDTEFPLDAQGRFTAVIGASQDMVSDGVLAREHATWLAWYDGLSEITHPEGNLILRNMLPEAVFTNAIQNIPVDQSNAAARATMGAYYPEAVYCDRSVFERSGVDACFQRVPTFTG